METVRRDAQLDRLMSELAWLRRLATALTRDTPDADDLVQETWLVASEHAPTDDRPLKPWLTRVALNVLRMRHRGTTRRIAREVAVVPVAASVPSPDELVTRIEAQKIVVDQVLLLAEPYRSTVLLHYVEDLSCAEIARRLGIPDGTVRRRLKVALDELRGRLREHEQTTGRAVIAALAPLAVPAASAVSVSTTLVGALVMKKIAVAIAVILAAVVAVTWLREDPGADEATASAHRSGSSTSTASMTGRPIDASQLIVEVRDHEGPIADAKVRLVRDDDDVTVVTTARDGTATSAAVVGRWSVAASADGHEPRGASVDVVAGHDARVTLVLAASGRTLTGTVVDVTGGPVAGARIDAARLDGNRPGRAVSVAFSDPAGHYKLSVLGGPLVVAASSPDYAAQTRHVDVGPSGAACDFTLVPGGVIEGVVRDDRTKEPAANAVVRTRHDGVLDLGEASQRVVTTDAAGAFRLTGLRPGAYELSARGERRISRVPVRVGLGVAEQQTDVVILVGAAATIRGTVVDDAGTPAAGVTVRALDGDAEGARAISDAAGAFVLDGLVPNRWGLRGGSDRYLPDGHSLVELKMADLDGVVVHVRRGLELAGHVEPRQACEVATSVAETGDVYASRQSPSVTTDDDGTFHFAPVAAGATTLTARCPSGDRGASEITIGADTREQPVHVEAGTAIAGIVVDPAGKPIAGVTVAAELRGPDSETATIFMNGAMASGARAIASSDGAFKIRGLAEGTYALSVLDRGRPMKATSGTKVELAHGQHATGVRVVVDRPAGTIRGRVTSEDGAPLADVWVSLHQTIGDLVAAMDTDDNEPHRVVVQSDGAGGDELQPALTDAQGRFELTNVPHGRYQIVAEAHAGALRATKADVTPDATVDIQLASVGAIRGTVHTTSGPSELFSVRLVGPTVDTRSQFGPSPAETRSFSDGNFVFPRVDPGDYTVEITSSDGSGRTTAHVTAGATVSLDIALVANAVISGRLVDKTGTPVSGRTVAMIPEQSPGQLQILVVGTPVSTGPDGRFRIAADPTRTTLAVLGAPPTLRPSLALASGKTLDVGDIVVGADLKRIR